MLISDSRDVAGFKSDGGSRPKKSLVPPPPPIFPDVPTLPPFPPTWTIVTLSGPRLPKRKESKRRKTYIYIRGIESFTC